MLQSDWLICLEQHWLYLITWVDIYIVTSSTYSFATDKFKQSHEIIVIIIEESLNFVVKINHMEYFQFLNRFGKVYSLNR